MPVEKVQAMLAQNQPPESDQRMQKSLLYSCNSCLWIGGGWRHSCYNHNNKRKLHFNDAAVVLRREDQQTEMCPN